MDTVIQLKRVSGGWKLYLPNSNEFGPLFRGDEHYVRECAKIFVSTWYNWKVDVTECFSKGEKNEPQKNRVYRVPF